MQISFTKRKVQYLYLILIVLSLLLGLVSYARAQEPEQLSEQGRPPATSPRGMEARPALTEERQNRFINLVRNVHTRMEAAIGRLESIASRLEERMKKLEAAGIDTSEAKPHVTEAKAKLQEVRTLLQDAKTEAEGSLVSDMPRERFASSRELFVTVRQTIREAFILLQQAVAELREAMQEAELNRIQVNDSLSTPTESTEETAAVESTN